MYLWKVTIISIALALISHNALGADRGKSFTLRHKEKRIVPRWFSCECSGRPRKQVSKEAVTFLRQGLFAGKVYGRYLGQKGVRGAKSYKENVKIVRAFFQQCRDQHGYSACAIADMEIRKEKGRKYSYCHFDKVTNRNLMRDVTGKVIVWRSTPFCREPKSLTNSGAEIREPEDNFGRSANNLTKTKSPNSQRAKEDKQINEGCVEESHIRGAVLQHKRHLLKTVYCANGFCATPNHGFIYRGRYTSMTELCVSEWKCIIEKRLVNNLRVTKNKKWATMLANGEQIVITPYDVRFPFALTWAVQILEELLNLPMLAFAIGVAVLYRFHTLRSLKPEIFQKLYS